MNKFIRFMVPLLIVFACIIVARWMMASKKKPTQFHRKKSPIVVETIRLKKEIYPVRLLTSGTVQPHTQSTLLPEVSGKITRISPNFREGGFFEAGEVLLEIDDRNYQAAATISHSALLSSRLALEQEKIRVANYQTELTIAESELAQARQRHSEEKAKAKQAQEDWERLNPGKAADDLVLRKPQLSSADASMKAIHASIEQINRKINLGPQEIAAAQGIVEARQAELDNARLNLERTKILAPYGARLLEKSVDIGQYVTPGTVLASVYAVDYFEVRLPLTNRQLEFIQFPAKNGHQPTPSSIDLPKAIIKANIGTINLQWHASIVRSEGAIDTQSRLLFVVARIDDPYGNKNENSFPLTIGQYVHAEIFGDPLKEVFVLPRSAVLENKWALTVDSKNQIQKKEISIVWEDRASIVSNQGVEENDILCITPLPFATNGTEVQRKTEGDDSGNSKPPSRSQKDHHQGKHP